MRRQHADRGAVGGNRARVFAGPGEAKRDRRAEHRDVRQHLQPDRQRQRRAGACKQSEERPGAEPEREGDRRHHQRDLRVVVIDVAGKIDDQRIEEEEHEDQRRDRRSAAGERARDCRRGAHQPEQEQRRPAGQRQVLAEPDGIAD